MATPTLYHSKLVPLGDVWVTVTSDVINSKFQGKPPFCAMIVNGTEYTYNTENPACAAALNGFKGRTILIRAEGREAVATLTVLEEDVTGHASTPVQQAAPPPRPAAAPVVRPAPQRVQAPAPVRPAAPVAHPAPAPAPVAATKLPEQSISEARDFLERNRLLLELCCYEAGKLAVTYNTVVMKNQIEAGVMPAATPEQIQSWTSCLFIEANHAGIGRTLPTDAENAGPPM